MIDPRIKIALDKERDRQSTTVELIASENYTSQEVMDLCGSILTNKYAEGLPGKRYYNGCANVDAIEFPGANKDADSRWALPITKVTAIVSPSALPKPNMMPPMTPALV